MTKYDDSALLIRELSQVGHGTHYEYDGRRITAMVFTQRRSAIVAGELMTVTHLLGRISYGLRGEVTNVYRNF